MDFEDRLRNQLHGQSNNIQVEIDSPVAVAHRSATRTRRRMVGLPVAALMLAGIVGGGIWASQDQDDTTESVALVGDESTEEDAATNDNDAAEADNESATEADAANDGPVDLEQLITQGFSPGPELVLQDISSANSPGGWGPTEVHNDNGVYYVLSTAPGRPAVDDFVSYRPDTLYTYDGNDWSISGFGDRLVADFDVDNNGVLYAVSTGTTANITEFALGQSTDGGQSWAWNALPSEGYDPATLSPRFATKGDTVLLVSQLPYHRNFAAAAELAQGAGLDINEYDITTANTVGVGYTEHRYDDDPCRAAEQRFWNESELRGPYDGAVDPTDEEGFEAAIDAYQLEREAALYATLRDAGCEQLATCRQISSDFYRDDANELPLPVPNFEAADAEEFEAFDQASRAFYNERQIVLDQLLIDGGCEQEVICRNIAEAFYEEGQIEPPFDAPAPITGDDLTEEQMQASDQAWNDYFERSEAWRVENQELIEASFARHQEELVAAGCESMATPEMPEMQFVEWSSLGVTAPADWTTTLVQTVGPNGVQKGDIDIGSYIFEVKVDGDEFVLIAASNGLPISPVDEYRNEEWRSVDGLNWARTPGGVAEVYNSAVVNGQHYTLTWDEGARGASLKRSMVGGEAKQQIELTELVPDLPDDLVPFQISGGPLGILIVANEMTYAAPPEEFYALFSPDGIRWSSQQIGSSAQLPAVGGESLMLFEYQTDPASQEPSAVYLGSLDG